jgi:hypothetical protein
MNYIYLAHDLIHFSEICKLKKEANFADPQIICAHVAFETLATAIWKCLSSGIFRRVVRLLSTDVSEKIIAFIFSFVE